MKFLMIVLAVRLIGEVISKKRMEAKNKNMDERNESIRHPAENQLR